jgi:DNA-binding CsgD family transcriptional regulator
MFGHLDSLSHAISSAGTSSFYDALLTALQHFAAVEQLRARSFGLAEGVALLGGSQPPAVRTLAVTDEAERLSLTEMFHEARGRRVLVRTRGDGGADGAQPLGMGYAWRHGNSLYLLDMFRSPKLGPFSADDQRRVAEAARLVASIVGVHATRHRVNQAVNGNCRDDIAEQVVKFLGAGLTRREAEVVSRIVMGMRTEAIAVELGIKAATVITFRKRAYAKLGVARQAELFARCVQVFSDLQPPRITAAVH